MNIVVTTQPTVEPVTVDEVKSLIQIEHSDDDLYISKLIIGARTDFERFTDTKLITQAVTIELDASDVYDPYEIRIPLQPVISLTSLKYYTAAGVLTTLTSGTDFYTAGLDPMRLVADDSNFTSERRVKAWEIKVSAGYGATAVSVPRDIRLCIKQIVALTFEDSIAKEWTDEIWRVVNAYSIIVPS